MTNSTHFFALVHQSDLWRQNDYTLEGYTTMRYTFDDIEQRPDQFIEDVRQMLGLLRRSGPLKR